MAQYLRTRCSGGTFFFTARLADRTSDLLVRDIDRLRDATRKTMRRYPFAIEAIVVLPAAIHTLWRLPAQDEDYSARWRMLKSLFSRGVTAPDTLSARQIERGEKGIWQRRFWEHRIRDAQDAAAHLQMIYTSPVQAGLCAHPLRWPHSSIHRDGMPSTHPFVGHGRALGTDGHTMGVAR